LHVQGVGDVRALDAERLGRASSRRPSPDLTGIPFSLVVHVAGGDAPDGREVSRRDVDQTPRASSIGTPQRWAALLLLVEHQLRYEPGVRANPVRFSTGCGQYPP